MIVIIVKMENDEKILVAIKNGDKNAFKILFDKYSVHLYDFSLRIVKDEQMSKDIVQELFISIWQRKDLLDSSLRIKPYLFKSIRNNSLKMLNRKDYFKYMDSQDLKIIPDSRMPNDEIEEKELYKAYLETIEKLPAKCREIFLLNRKDGFSYAEISDILDISINTVKTQIGRALSFLRNQLSHFMINDK